MIPLATTRAFLVRQGLSAVLWKGGQGESKVQGF